MSFFCTKNKKGNSKAVISNRIDLYYKFLPISLGHLPFRPQFLLFSTDWSPACKINEIGRSSIESWMAKCDPRHGRYPFSSRFEFRYLKLLWNMEAKRRIVEQKTEPKLVNNQTKWTEIGHHYHINLILLLTDLSSLLSETRLTRTCRDQKSENWIQIHQHRNELKRNWLARAHGLLSDVPRRCRPQGLFTFR